MKYDFEHLIVVKRSGQRVAFNGAKIAIAIKSAFDHLQESNNEKNINKVYTMVLDFIHSVYRERKTINVEDIQDIIESTLKKAGYTNVYQAFNDYRIKRAASREAFSVKAQHKFVKSIEKIANVRNLDENKPMDLMINFGKTIGQGYAEAYLIENKYIRAHEEGRIFLKSLSSYALGITESSHLDYTNCCIDDIQEFTLYLIRSLTHFKEEQYQEQTVCNLDQIYVYSLVQEFKKDYIAKLKEMFSWEGIYPYVSMDLFEEKIRSFQKIQRLCCDEIETHSKIDTIFQRAYEIVLQHLMEKLEKAFEYFLSMIEDFHFKFASNQISISISFDCSFESEMIRDSYFHVLRKFPKLKNSITIFKMNKDYNIELLYSLLHQDIVLLYPDSISYDDEIEVFQNGMMIYKNINQDLQTSKGKILLSTVAINLARLGLKYTKNNLDDFYEELESVLEISKNALLQRYEFQANKLKENYHYLFENHFLYDSYKLEAGQKVRKVLRNGSLNISYVGLVSCLQFLLKKDVLEEKDFKLGFDILKFMNEKIESYSVENKLNFILSEEDDEAIHRSFMAIDKAMYGIYPKLPRYPLVSEAIKSFSIEEKMLIARKMQEFSSFGFTLSISKHISLKKFEQIVQSGFVNKVKFIQVRFCGNDN